MMSCYDLKGGARMALTEQAMAHKQTLLRRCDNLPVATTSNWTPRKAKAAAFLTGCEAVVDRASRRSSSLSSTNGTG
jgi:hypothetical protein